MRVCVRNEPGSNPILYFFLFFVSNVSPSSEHFFFIWLQKADISFQNNKAI